MKSRSVFYIGLSVFSPGRKYSINRPLFAITRNHHSMTSPLRSQLSRSPDGQLPTARLGSSADDQSRRPACDGPAVNGVRRRYGDIVKSDGDKREYRGLELENRIKVLLVSDPTTDKSAAALDVNIGYLSDPDSLPGLAHFCEHMLFLGTDKYPEENAYNKFLSEHGGSCNAMTMTDHTTYYFNILPQHLHGALDIFAQFFISPLFTESATDRELNAVNSEHDKNTSSDTWRLDQLGKTLADPSHPYSKFGTGNRETLELLPRRQGINVREELLKFHERWYSSNVMTLVVFGKESLDELEKMVLELFSDVRDRTVESPSWGGSPYPQVLRRKKTYVVPVKDLRNLNILFPIGDYRMHYKSGPPHYLSHLLGHEGPGSLLSVLRARGWCNSLTAGAQNAARGFSFFQINVDLTEEGIKHTDDIVKLTFQYINMLRREGVQQWIFEEQCNLLRTEFRFKDVADPRSLVVNCVHNLQDYPVEDVLSVHYSVTDWRPDMIEELLATMTPENIRVTVIGKCYDGVCGLQEKWYGTKYHVEDIDKAVLEDWRNAGFCSELHLPALNEFIPENLTLVPRESSASGQTDEAVDACIVLDTSRMRLWYRMDTEFLLPKACVTFEFVSPISYSEPLACNLNSIWVRMLKDSLVEYAYAAQLAGLSWFIANSKNGITVGIEGFDDKQHILLEKIVDKMTDFKADPKRFVIMKEAHSRSLKNIEADQPYQHAVYHQSVCLTHVAWTREQLRDTVEAVTVEQLEDYARRMLSRVHVEGLVYGNVTKERALTMAKIIEDKLPKDGVPLLAQHLLPNREIELEKGVGYLREVTNSIHKSSCACVYYPCGVVGTRCNVTLELVAQLLHEPCFNVLRTKEQLGYIVFSGLRRTHGVQGLRVIVQSDKHPAYLDERVEAFLASMKDHISSMSDEEFARHKSSLAAQRLERPKRISSRFSQLWSEISAQQYNFDRNRIEVAELDGITKAELLEYFERYICQSSAERQKMAVYIVSMAEGGAGLEKTEPAEVKQDELVRISDVIEFKSSRSLYSQPKPFLNVPRKGTRHSKL